MNSSDLSREQLDQLTEKAREMTAWLHALQQRMESTGFPAKDDLLVQTKAAFDRVQHLFMTLHYLGCDAGKRK